MGRTTGLRRRPSAPAKSGRHLVVMLVVLRLVRLVADHVAAGRAGSTTDESACLGVRPAATEGQEQRRHEQGREQGHSYVSTHFGHSNLGRATRAPLHLAERAV